MWTGFLFVCLVNLVNSTPRNVYLHPLRYSLIGVCACCMPYFAHSQLPMPDRVPDSIKLHVSNARMIQVMGREIAQCIAEANMAEQTKEVEGPQVFTPAGAARANDSDTPDAGGIQGTWDTQVTVVRSIDEPGVSARGEYCIKVAGPQSDRTDDSGIYQPPSRFLLRANTRYRMSCQVFCEQPKERFVLAVQCDERIINTSQSMKLRANNSDDTGEYFRNVPGEWTPFTGIITTPDEGDRNYQLWIHHEGGGLLTWYLDDVSLVEVRSETHREAFREKSPEEAALSLSSLNANRVNLYNGGVTVPIRVEHTAEGGGFLPETVLTFWGDPPVSHDGGKNLVTRENVYILQFDSLDPPRRYRVMPPASPPKGANVVHTYRRTLHIEDDNQLQFQRYDGPPTDRVMWTTFKAPPREPAAVALPPLADLAGASSEISVRVFLWGWTDLPEEPDHNWSLAVNGAALGRAVWDGTRHALVEGAVGSKHFDIKTNNSLTFQQTNPDLPIDMISLDWIELSYEATLLPRDDFLEFSIDPNGNARYARTLPGFTGPGVRVYSGGKDVELQPRVTKENNLFRAEFSLSEGAADFRLTGPDGYARPDRLSMGYRSNLRQRERSPEFLIVSHASFLNALRPLVAQRVEQGLDTWAVDVDDVYDEYASGMFEPQAIRWFVDDLLKDRDGDTPRLKYLWLVGDATYDYKGVRPGSRNFVPTHHSDEADILPTYSPTFAHDDYFAFGPDGGRAPLAAVGRYPANTIDAVEAYVAKVLEYERNLGNDAAWQTRAVLISSKDFNRFSDDTESNVLDGWTVANLTGTGDAEGDVQLRDDIVASISAGCGVVTFSGHGAYYVWRTGENMNHQRTDMMTDREIHRLSNRGKYPIVFAATCFSALFDAPIHRESRVDSGVGIYFVEAPERGAVALIGHVGKIDVDASHRFNRSILEGLASGAGHRLGDLFLSAKQQFPQSGFDGIALIGDPSLVLAAQ